MPVLEVKHLELVQAICETGSLVRAGTRLNLSAPALSHALKSLEHRLGVRLFERASRMIPTPAGEALNGSARDILALVHSAEEALQDSRKGQSGTVRVATECYTSYHWLTAVSRAMRGLIPNVTVHIAPEASSRPHEALLAGELDVAVVHSRPTQDRILCEPLFKDELLLVVAPDHPLALRRRPAVAPEDFAPETVLTHEGLERTSLWKGFLESSGVRPARVSTLRVTEAVLESVRAGLGVAVLARWVVARQIASGEFVGLRLGTRGLHRRWYGATLRSADAPATAALMSVLRADSARVITALLGEPRPPGGSAGPPRAAGGR